VFLGESDRSSHDEILCEDGGSRGRDVAGENREIERARFFQAAGGGGEAESFGKLRLRWELASSKHDPAHDFIAPIPLVKLRKRPADGSGGSSTGNILGGKCCA